MFTLYINFWSAVLSVLQHRDKQTHIDRHTQTDTYRRKTYHTASPSIAEAHMNKLNITINDNDNYHLVNKNDY